LLALCGMRDHRKLTAFHKADALVLEVYTGTEALPIDEKYILRSQIRRSAISIPSNIVAGCARTTAREYLNHLNIALGSAAELAYLLELTGRRYPSLREEGHSPPAQANEVIRLLVGLVDGLRRSTTGTQPPKGLKPKA
jgi:four helix bundle protein